MLGANRSSPGQAMTDKAYTSETAAERDRMLSVSFAIP
jgi:hypothetical protein